MLRNIDLSSCKLEDLQKLVNFTTNAMALSPPSQSSQPSIPPHNHHQEKFHSEYYSGKESFIKKQKEEVLKYASQDSGYISDDIDTKPIISKGNIET